tara:strand:- start:487 stop:897 length:411 start_codon:yes stop_codon:yes gene_type:complete
MVKGEKEMLSIDKNDFALVFKCIENDEGVWDGHIDITHKYSKNNEYGKYAIDTCVKMMSLLRTCVQLMNVDKKFLEKVHREYDKEEKKYAQWKERNRIWNVQKEMDDQDSLENKVKESPKVISTDGNVIKVDWRQV